MILHHNLDPDAFVWLFARYVRGVDPSHHCTHALRGPYSKRLSKHNPRLSEQVVLPLDEQPAGSFAAVYLCGVASIGYRKKRNYSHNLHVALQPAPGVLDRLVFERWELEVEHGRFLSIPEEAELPAPYRCLPPEFTTCRIFRWAVVTGTSLFARSAG